MQPDITYCTQLLIHVQRNTKTSIKNVPNDSERLRNREGSYEIAGKGLAVQMQLRKKEAGHERWLWSVMACAKRLCEKNHKESSTADLFHKFKESDGFIEKILPCNNLIGVSLHGEGNEMSEEVADALMRPLRDSWVNCVKRIIFLLNDNVVDLCAQLLTSLPGNHGTCIFTVFLNTKMQKDDAVVGIWINIVNKL